MEKGNLTYREYAELAHLPLDEVARQCDVQVFRATGPGGQGVNTTDSAVRMVHRPSGVTVVSRESRSQWQNRQNCLRKLHDIFVRRSVRPKHRKKTKVSRAERERRLRNKRFRSEVKRFRSRPGDE